MVITNPQANKSTTINNNQRIQTWPHFCGYPNLFTFRYRGLFWSRQLEFSPLHRPRYHSILLERKDVPRVSKPKKPRSERFIGKNTDNNQYKLEIFQCYVWLPDTPKILRTWVILNNNETNINISTLQLQYFRNRFCTSLHTLTHLHTTRSSQSFLAENSLVTVPGSPCKFIFLIRVCFSTNV